MVEHKEGGGGTEGGACADQGDQMIGRLGINNGACRQEVVALRFILCAAQQ